jgi:hypothetical protein
MIKKIILNIHVSLENMCMYLYFKNMNWYFPKYNYLENMNLHLSPIFCIL